MVRARLAWFRELADPSVASGPTSPIDLVWRIKCGVLWFRAVDTAAVL